MNSQYRFIATLFCFCIFGQVNGQFYSSAESVEYDPVNNQWLISNGNNIIADDGQGNLSFFGSSSAGYGMEVLGNVVYGVGSSQIVAVDLTTQAELATINIPGSSFLNGLTNDGISTLYATDFSGRKIYKIDVSDINNPIVETLIANTIESPNGIFYDGPNNRLIYLTWESNAKIKAIDLDDLTISTIITTELGFLDGIDEDNEGNFYVSSWEPDIITKFDSEFETSIIIDTPTLDSPADIGYNKEDDIIGIPVGNDVIFVEVGEGSVSVDDINENLVSFDVTSDLNGDFIQLGISVLTKEHLRIDILNISGYKIKEAMNQTLEPGDHSLDINMSQFSSGTYIVVLKTSKGSHISKKVILL